MPKGALYWYGNECTWLSGGWLLNASRILYKEETNDIGWTDAGSQYATVTKNTNNIMLKSGIDPDTKYACVGTSQVIDSVYYNKLRCTLNIMHTRKPDSGIELYCVSTSKRLKGLYFGVSSQTKSTYEINISDVTSCGFDLSAISYDLNDTQYYVDSVWFE